MYRKDRKVGEKRGIYGEIKLERPKWIYKFIGWDIRRNSFYF